MYISLTGMSMKINQRIVIPGRDVFPVAVHSSWHGKKGSGLVDASPLFYLCGFDEFRHSRTRVVSRAAYLFAPMPDILTGMGSLPSAPSVSVTKALSSRIDEKTASTRASIISLARTER